MSAAILFYGYNLGAPDDSGWAIEGADNFDEEWFEHSTGSSLTDWEPDYVGAMRDEILDRYGLIPLKDFDSSNAKEKLAKHCGVEVVSFGHSNTTFYGLALAGTVHQATDWYPKHVAPIAGGDAGKLREALDKLGMKPLQANPSWILAPQEY